LLLTRAGRSLFETGGIAIKPNPPAAGFASVQDQLEKAIGIAGTRKFASQVVASVVDGVLIYEYPVPELISVANNRPDFLIQQALVGCRQERERTFEIVIAGRRFAGTVAGNRAYANARRKGLLENGEQRGLI